MKRSHVINLKLASDKDKKPTISATALGGINSKRVLVKFINKGTTFEVIFHGSRPKTLKNGIKKWTTYYCDYTSFPLEIMPKVGVENQIPIEVLDIQPLYADPLS